MVFFMAIIGFINRKGGAGKTTLAVGVAGALSHRHQVGLIDSDPQGSAVHWLAGFDGFPVVHAADGDTLSRALETASHHPEVLTVVDAPPLAPEATGAILAHADLVVVPVTPSAVDLDVSRGLLKHISESGRRGLAVLNMADPRTTISRDMREVIPRFGVPLAETEIHRRVAHAEASVARLPVTHYHRGSLAAGEVRDLAREILEHLED